MQKKNASDRLTKAQKELAEAQTSFTEMNELEKSFGENSEVVKETDPAPTDVQKTIIVEHQPAKNNTPLPKTVPVSFPRIAPMEISQEIGDEDEDDLLTEEFYNSEEFKIATQHDIAEMLKKKIKVEDVRK
jgi:hypothetical protein